MNSFYTQQTQTLFSANHFTNQNMFPQVGQQYMLQYNMRGGYQQPASAYMAPTHSYRLEPRQVPADWTASQHIISRPPTEPVAFEKMESPDCAAVAPPVFRVQLSDPAFLLEPESPKARPVLAPPKMNRKLSDPSFLLEPDAKTEIVQVGEVLDEWDIEEPLAFEEARSKSIESGSSYSSGSKQSAFEERIKVEKHQDVLPERISFAAQTLPQQKRPRNAPKPAEDWEKDTRVRVVQRRRKRKTIESGKSYRAKRFIKVTKEDDPCAYGKPKSRRERDPNEIWTVRRGVEMEIIEVRDKRAYIYCVVEFWSKYQDRNRDEPRRKKVEGWITLKDKKGWVL